MGLERIVTILQGKESVYETELFLPILEKIRELAKKQDIKAERIVADHIRAATFIIADGVVPSNKDRGYILRRLIRRAVRYGQVLGIEQEFCTEIGAVVIHKYSEAYPELLKRQEKIVEALAREDLEFHKKLSSGLKYFEKLLVVDGKATFNLLQTYGFPPELTEELVREREAKLVQTPVVMASTGNLTVSLAGDTPSASTVVKSAARVPFTKVNLTATGGDVTIDTLIVERMGPAVDSNFQDIILLDVSNGVSMGEANRISSELTLSSQHRTTFRGPIRIANGTTKSIMLAAHMGVSLNSSEKASLALVDMTLLGSATFSGALPIGGNLMTMNNKITIATATVKASAFPSTTTQEVGTQDYAVASLQIINDSVEKVEASKIVFTQNGSAGDSDIRNIRLVVDGSVISKIDQPANKIISFILDKPEVLDKGQTRNVVIRLDIVNGSGQAVQLKIVSKADIVLRGQTYGLYILPYYQDGAGMSVKESPFYRSAWTEFRTEFKKHQALSRTSSAGRFKGGLADASGDWRTHLSRRPDFIPRIISF
ncbi:MAG: Alanine-tRNA ligase, partial [Parcubacteria group bacterium GW2011_GWA2_51_12]